MATVPKCVPPAVDPPDCPHCHQQLKQVREKKVSNSYTFVQGRFHLVDTNYAEAEYYCVLCGKPLPSGLAQIIVDLLE